jgi:hypothetical protein
VEPEIESQSVVPVEPESSSRELQQNLNLES